jgi:glutamine synthetase
MFSETLRSVRGASRQLRNLSASLEGYGQHLFKGKVAAPYLEKAGLPKDTLDTAAWTTNGKADKVAAAVLEWAKDNGASVYCHWFQPLGSSGVRHGQSAQVQNTMMEFSKDGTPVWDFKGKNILKGETDGSSYPNGGLRATHRAGGYLSVDPTSPIFLRGDTIFIPSCLVSYYGHALDEKTPLLRASDAMSKEGARLLGHLGYKVKGIQANIGLEQEIFLIPRSAYFKRPDLQLSGRTVLGRMPPRGQEMSDHYMAPPSLTSSALACMQEIQDQCFRMGIPLRTRHREVAPNQYEFAPLYGTVTTQIDQNLMVMQIIEEVAASHGLAALLQEKPFQGVNGSGKHNNWSIATDDGTNLLNVGQLAAKAGPDVFPVIMAAIVKAINENGDLMRLAIATPGNDFRLGACEAPPGLSPSLSLLSFSSSSLLTSFSDPSQPSSRRTWVTT